MFNVFINKKLPFIVFSSFVMTACGGGSDSSPESETNTVAAVEPEVNIEIPVISSSTELEVLSEITLIADGNISNDNTYTLIENAFAVGSIESPDLYSNNHTSVQHITQESDEVVGNYFVFLAHRDLDYDRDKGETDRQRNEIKAYDQSINELKAFENETMQFTWKFKVLGGMELSSNFSHFFQLKAKNDTEDNSNGNDSHPIMTISGAEKNSTGNELQVRHNIGSTPDGESTSTNYIYAGNWYDITDEWVEVFVQATFAEEGELLVTMTKLSDSEVIIDLHETDIDMWRGNNSDDFVRPKWGIYRSTKNAESLRVDEERVYFTDFSVKKVNK